ncbi:MAG TPA: septum formation initiator family protein [Patescibacteria group bacterium]|nr:septum formation initiator family protein [Patescibacteria group bacterium]
MGKNGKLGINLRKSLNKAAGYAIWFLILLLALSTLRSINSASRVRAQIKAEAEKVAKMERDNIELQNKVAMSQGEDFMEREIRNKLGLVKNGEVIVVLPDAEILKQLAPIEPQDQESLPDPNWKRWLNLFI